MYNIIIDCFGGLISTSNHAISGAGAAGHSIIGTLQGKTRRVLIIGLVDCIFNVPPHCSTLNLLHAHRSNKSMLMTRVQANGILTLPTDWECSACRYEHPKLEDKKKDMIQAQAAQSNTNSQAKSPKCSVSSKLRLLRGTPR